MSNLNKAWFPKTKGLSEAQRAALMVPGQPQSTADLLPLLVEKLAELIKSEPRAGELLAMSQENAPELLEISQQVPQAQWPRALADSDGMMALLARIDWSQEAQPKGQPVMRPAPISLQELLEQIA